MESANSCGEDLGQYFKYFMHGESDCDHGDDDDIDDDDVEVNEEQSVKREELLQKQIKVRNLSSS